MKKLKSAIINTCNLSTYISDLITGSGYSQDVAHGITSAIMGAYYNKPWYYAELAVVSAYLFIEKGVLTFDRNTLVSALDKVFIDAENIDVTPMPV